MPNEESERRLNGEFSKIIREMAKDVSETRATINAYKDMLTTHISLTRDKLDKVTEKHSALELRVATFESGGCKPLGVLSEKLDSMPGKMTTRLAVGFTIVTVIISVLMFAMKFLGTP